MSLLQQRQPSRLARPARAPLRVVLSRAIVTDNSVRVRGDSVRVSRYLADVSSWREWYPGLVKAQRVGSALDAVSPGCRWEVQQQHWTLNLPMRYELVEASNGKKLVFSAISEYHTVQEQFFFMTDRHDPGWTSVRHMSSVSLREWRSALTPVVSNLLSQVPEKALGRLQSRLNSSTSPLYSAAFEDAWRQERSGGGGGGASTGTQRTRVRGAGAGASNNISSTVSSWASSLFAGSRAGGASQSKARGGGASETAQQQQQQPVADPMGYYKALGLVLLPGAPPPSSEVIKAAYRALALQLHPDRQAGAPERTRRAAAERFAALLRAYEVLKDEDKRALYARGLLLEETTIF